MFKKFSAVALVIVLGFFTAKADEGMWLPLLLSDNEAEMQELLIKELDSYRLRKYKKREKQ